MRKNYEQVALERELALLEREYAQLVERELRRQRMDRLVLLICMFTLILLSVGYVFMS